MPWLNFVDAGNESEVKLTLSVPPSPRVLPAIRHTVLAWLTGAGYSGVGTDDVLVVVSELVTNGVIHDGDHDIEIGAALDGADGICIEVVTVNCGLGEPRPGTAYMGDRRDGGRGLVIVSALTDNLLIEDQGGRRRVACHVRLAA